MATVALHTTPDGLLAAVAPLGCAAAAGTALVVDLDPRGLPLPGSRSLRDLVEDGPTAQELAPHRRGVASLPNGGITIDEAGEVVDALRSSWPHVVLRIASEQDSPPDALGVAVRPLLRGVSASELLPTVLQPLGLGDEPTGVHGHRLPGLPARTATALYSGRLAKGRWVRAWAALWARA